MTGNKAFVVIAITTALGILGTVPAAASDHNGSGRATGNVVPCSLAGVNPAYHPEIFGNPAVAAREYGFVQSRDGVWHVQCSGVGTPAAADNYASTTQKAPGHHRKRLKP